MAAETRHRQEDHLWSTEELAQFLGVPLKTIYAWRHRNLGPPAYRLGKHLRFRREDVEAWLQQKRPSS
jgi:excisionase family DNA binding protein